jgi:hypothetical protein
MVERLLGIIVQPLLVWWAVCFGHHFFGFIILEALLEYLYKDLRLTDVLAVLPHCVENVTEDIEELLSMRFLYGT